MIPYKKILKFSKLFLLLSGFLCNCEPHPEDDHPRGGSGSEEAVAKSSSAVLMSGTLAVSSALRLKEDDEDFTDCPVQTDSAPIDGLCFTPLEITGIAHFVNAIDGSLSATYEDQARIVKAGETGEESEGQVVEGSAYSLKNPETFSGINELWSVYENKPKTSHP